ncbi:MAG: ribosome biogenesis GTPase Der [Deltaproteobacteria bacterium]|nr:ribosome biogenesis GTPase Der [Deltaproteobacteria bacterium]
MSVSSPLPIVAIVGRPNVGKSRLFNRYAGHSRALVHNQPGITRDRIAEEVRVETPGPGGRVRRILLVDTAGLDRGSEGDLEARVQAQARCAVEQADAVLFVVDSKSGLLPEDEEIARTLRRTRKPLLLVVNKVDIPAHMERLGEFYGLGFEAVHAVSAEHGSGAFEALEELVAALPEAPTEEGEERAARRFFGPPELASEAIPDFSEEALDADFGAGEEEEAEETSAEADAGAEAAGEIRVAIVGRPNVGKSSLVNRLLGEERVVVSSVPGTTRDAIDIHLEHDGNPYLLVDTAGLRRPGRREPIAERFSALMTVRSLERAEVAILVLDACEGFTDQDAHIANLLRERGCAAVVVANKWDLVPGEKAEEVLDGIRHGLRFMADVPVVSISAKTGSRLPRIFPALRRVAASGRTRVRTSELNRWLQESVRAHEPSMARKGFSRRAIRFFYAAQTGISPPSFLLFCTEPKAIQVSYRRFLENRLRERFGFEGTPVRLRLRARARTGTRGK